MASITTIISAVFSTIFLLILISYYILLFKPRSRPQGKPHPFKTLSIIIPAHNEERYINACIQSALSADFPGKREIIVIDDGSTDKTAAIARQYPVKLLRRAHQGKSASINEALRIAKGEAIAIIDGDSEIAKDALAKALALLATRKDIAAVCSTIRVKNRRGIIGTYLHIEQLYNSLVRSLVSKVNANIVASGPLSVFRASCLHEIGGFSTEGFSEDIDIAIRLIRAGYLVECAEDSITETNMPTTPKGYARQRRRFARGALNIFRQHLRLDHTFVRIYTLPLLLFGYLQAVIMGIVTIYSIVSGYLLYFGSQGLWTSWEAIKYFIEWLSIIGVIRWAMSIFAGTTPLTLFTLISLLATLLTYPLYLIAIVRYDRRISWRTILALAFMFPYWIASMFIYLFSIPELFKKEQRNIWHK